MTWALNTAYKRRGNLTDTFQSQRVLNLKKFKTYDILSIESIEKYKIYLDIFTCSRGTLVMVGLLTLREFKLEGRTAHKSCAYPDKNDL